MSRLLFHPRCRQLPSCLLLLLHAAGASAQSISVGPLAAPGAGATAVPADNPLALGLLLAALALAGWWHLRRGGAAHRVMAWVLVSALGTAAYMGGGSTLLALPGNAFTNAAGQTLPIPVNPTSGGGYFTGFAAQDFFNSSGQALRITAIVPPNLAQCFTSGAHEASKLLQPGTPNPGTPCSQGAQLANGASCRVDVDTLCRSLLGSPPTLASISPSSGAAAGGTSVTLTGTGLADAMSVVFDGFPATGVAPAGDGQTITAATPAHAAGAVDVAVETPAGTVRLAGGYTYAYAVGQALQGGVIASLDGSGQPALIAPAADNAIIALWAGVYQTTGATSITDGATNTLMIAAAPGASASHAAGVCDQSTDGGYSDWFLPAQDQLNTLYANQAAIGGFAAVFYWSSTEDSISNAWVKSFGTGTALSGLKDQLLRVRCVRQYTP